MRGILIPSNDDTNQKPLIATFGSSVSPKYDKFWEHNTTQHFPLNLVECLGRMRERSYSKRRNEAKREETKMRNEAKKGERQKETMGKCLKRKGVGTAA